MNTFRQTLELVPSTRSFLFHGMLKPILWITPIYILVVFGLSRFRIFATP